MFSFLSLIQWGLPQMQIVILWFSCSSFRIFISLGQLAEENGSQYFKSWARKLWKELKPFVFNEVSLISKSHLGVKLYLFLGSFRHYSNLEKLPPRVLDFNSFVHFYFLTIQNFQLLFHNGGILLFWSSGSCDIGK